MQTYSPGAHDPPGAAHGMQFRFSAFLVEAVSLCYSTEGKKDWTSLAELGTNHTGHLVPAQHQPQPHGGTEARDLLSEFSTLHLSALNMYKIGKV